MSDHPFLPLLSSIRLTSLPTLTRREGRNNPQGSYKDLLNPLISPSNYVFQLLYVFRFVWPPVAVTHSLTHYSGVAAPSPRVTRCTCMYISCFLVVRLFVDGGERDVSDIWINAHPPRYWTDQWQNVRFSLLDALFFFHLAKASIFLQKERYRSVDERWCDDAILAVTGCCWQCSKQSSWFWVAYHQPSYKEDETESKCIPIRSATAIWESESDWDCTAESFVSLVGFSHATSPCWFIPCRATRRMN